MKISEFKMWLDGVLAFNEDRDNWKPTAKQWAVIYQKIKQLEESPPIIQHPPRGPITSMQQEQSAFTIPIVTQTYDSFTPEQLEKMKLTALAGGAVQAGTGIIDPDVTKDFV